MADLTPEALAPVLRQVHDDAVAGILGVNPHEAWTAVARAAIDALAPAHAALTGQLSVMTAARDDLARELDKALAFAATVERDWNTARDLQLSYRAALEQVKRTAEYFDHKGELNIASEALEAGNG